METWLIVLISFVVGVLVSYFVLRAKDSPKKQAQAETELQKVKEELNQQQQRLEQHFSETADLFKLLAQDYQKLYRHLAKSSDDLLPESQKTLFLQSFMNSDKSTAAEPHPDDQPLDYSEGSSGILKAER